MPPGQADRARVQQSGEVPEEKQARPDRRCGEHLAEPRDQGQDPDAFDRDGVFLVGDEPAAFLRVPQVLPPGSLITGPMCMTGLIAKTCIAIRHTVTHASAWRKCGGISLARAQLVSRVVGRAHCESIRSASVPSVGRSVAQATTPSGRTSAALRSARLRPAHRRYEASPW